MVFTGMSPDQITVAANQLRAQAQELFSIRSRVNSLVSEASAHWDGRDVAAFRSSWYGSQQARLTATANRLDSMATHLNQQATQQRITSGDGVGVARLGGAPPKIPAQPVDWMGLGQVTGKGITTYAGVKRAVDVVRLVAGGSSASAIAARLTGQAGTFLTKTLPNWVSKIAPKVGATLGKIAPVVGKGLSFLGGAYMAIDGAIDIFYPDYPGGRGVVDRIMGGVGVIGGGGLALVAVGALSLGPVGMAVVAGAAAAVAVWELGNLVYDNWDNITNAVGQAGTWVADRAADLGNAVGNTATAVVNTVGETASAVGNAIGGAAKGAWDCLTGWFG